MTQNIEIPERLAKHDIDVLVTVALDTATNRVMTLDFDASTREHPVLAWKLLTPDEMGAWLYEMNDEARACAFAVNEQEPPLSSVPDPYKWDRATLPDNPLIILKLINHYIYHSCLASRWYFSDQREFCNLMMGMLFSHIDGYEEAKW